MTTNDCGGVVGQITPTRTLGKSEKGFNAEMWFLGIESSQFESGPQSTPCSSYLVGGFEWMHEVGYGYLGEEIGDETIGERIVRDDHGDPPHAEEVPRLDDGGRVYAAEWPAQLTEPQVRAVLSEAGWSGRRLDEAVWISFCEVSLGTPYWHTDKRGDGGIAYGLFQIHWFPERGWDGWGLPAVRAGYITEAEYLLPDDPIVNAKVARYIVESRGYWGGIGGWKTCAENAGVE